MYKYELVLPCRVAQETQSLAACLAAPPSEVEEDGRERAHERTSTQRAGAANASR